MKQIVILIICLIITLLLGAYLIWLESCKPVSCDYVISNQALGATNQLTATKVENRVKEIYATVFKAYNDEDTALDLTALEEKRKKFNAEYCSRGWNQLLNVVNRIDSIDFHGEMGFFDFDYWIMAQDWKDLSVSDVKALAYSPHMVQVEFLLHNLGHAKPVTLLMVNERGLWKIDSFQDEENPHDLKRAMRMYIDIKFGNYPVREIR